MHPRRIIRERLVELLKGATDAGDRVHDSRPWNVFPNQTPTIRVFTPRDDVELHRQAPRAFKGTVTAEIEIYVRDRITTGPNAAKIPASQILDDVVEQVCAKLEVEPLLRDVAGLDPAAVFSEPNGQLQSIETDFAEGDGLVLAAARLSWRYQYLRLAAREPIPPSLPLDSVEVEYELDGNNSVPEAVDSVDLTG